MLWIFHDIVNPESHTDFESWFDFVDFMLIIFYDLSSLACSWRHCSSLEGHTLRPKYEHLEATYWTNCKKRYADDFILIWLDWKKGCIKFDFFSLSSRINEHFVGYRVVLSSCWYLNHINYPYPNNDWEHYYLCNPKDFTGS